MGLPLYLAKTHREMLEAEGPLSAYMACHFSPYGDGLEVPEALPDAPHPARSIADASTAAVI